MESLTPFVQIQHFGSAFLSSYYIPSKFSQNSVGFPRSNLLDELFTKSSWNVSTTLLLSCWMSYCADPFCSHEHKLLMCASLEPWHLPAMFKIVQDFSQRTTKSFLSTLPWSSPHIFPFTPLLPHWTSHWFCKSWTSFPAINMPALTLSWHCQVLSVSYIVASGG